jgi:hypothetical protein
MARTATTHSGKPSAEGRREARKHGDTLPGTNKFPIRNAAEVAKAKHDIGRTTEPRAKVVAYIDREAKKYGAAPVGGGKSEVHHGHEGHRRGTGSHEGHHLTGMEQAMHDHADKIHPVHRG